MSADSEPFHSTYSVPLASNFTVTVADAVSRLNTLRKSQTRWVDDAGAGTAALLVWTNGTAWFHVAGTKAL